MAGAVVREDEGEDLPGPGRVVVEGAVDQLDLGHLPLHEQAQVGADALHREGAHRLIEGAHAEGAGVGAAAARLQVDEPPGEVDQAEAEGGGDVRRAPPAGGRRGPRRSSPPPARPDAGSLRSLTAHPGREQAPQGEFAFAAHQGAHPGMAPEEIRSVEGDLRPSEDDTHLRSRHRQGVDQLQGLPPVPEVDRKSDDVGLPGEQGGKDVPLGLVHGELPEVAALRTLARKRRPGRAGRGSDG